MGKVTETHWDSRIAQDVINSKCSFDLGGWCGAGQKGGGWLLRRELEPDSRKGGPGCREAQRQKALCLPLISVFFAVVGFIKRV